MRFPAASSETDGGRRCAVRAGNSPTGARPPDGGCAARRLRLWGRVAFLAAIACCAVWLHFRLAHLNVFSRDGLAAALQFLANRIGGLGVFGPPAFAAAFSAAMVLSFPTATIVFLAATFFGPVAGAILSLATAAAGVTLVHLVAQRAGRPLLLRFFAGRIESAEAWLQGRELAAVIGMRLVFFMNPVSNWALGLSAIRLRHLVLGTLIGAAPGIGLIAWLSGELADAIRAGASVDPWRSPRLLVPLVLVPVFFAGTALAARLRRRRRGRAAAPDGAHGGCNSHVL